MSENLINLESEIGLDTLVSLFFSDPSMVGDFKLVQPAKLPEHFRFLLNHEGHMTVTLEQHYDEHVNVQVLDTRHDKRFYSRKILLDRKSDHKVVQFGIVTLDTRKLPPITFAEIAKQETPLGRVLIDHHVHREVHLFKLYQIAAGPELAKHFGIAEGEMVAGRTAIIDCCGGPAIGLLEIVV
ncbi:hypothetical protein OAG71_02010 [bacterium]|nr:hypothetical protein [bacterium]